MSTNYSLGASDDEQSRLLLQRELYGDTQNICFRETDSVCEFGCGAGANLWIAQSLSSGRYVGIDVQQEAGKFDQRSFLTQTLWIADAKLKT
jgi:hypothetical protein